MNASKKTGETYFNYIGSITLNWEIVELLSSKGDQTQNVKDCLSLPEIKAELADIKPKKLRKELAEVGAWTKKQLKSHDDNLERILWIAACNISEESNY